jgi:uncharacterized repeat protein (TIGR03803 family)
MYTSQPKAREVNQFSRWKMACVAFLLCIAAALAASAQTFTTLASFTTSGWDPENTLVQGADGDFYGVTLVGGANQSICSSSGYGCGTVFKVSPTGTITILHKFCSHTPCTDGFSPSGALVRGGDGNFYGTTPSGGANSSATHCSKGCGTIFRITPSGTLTTLYSFCALANCADGYSPLALMQALNGGSSYGSFYGTTSGGGASNLGSVFSLTPQGQLNTLYSFGTDFFAAGQLIQTPGANFYGAAPAGPGNVGNCSAGNNCGAIFRMTPTGTVTPLQIFSNATGPSSPLLQGTDGLFYGTAIWGGAGILQCSPYGCGTAFKISPAGVVTTLHNFCSLANCTDGSGPGAGLTLATDGNFYGTTGGTFYAACNGGANNCPGTLFVMTTSGVLTTLHVFCAQANCADGGATYAGLLQSTNGKFYGTTPTGGANTCIGPNSCGTVFSLDVGLGPFVTFLVSTGRVGQTVGILGQGLTGTTSVSFNGTAAAFTVKSDTFLTANVPAGATTGTVQVATPSGTLFSNIVFRVTP